MSKEQIEDMKAVLISIQPKWCELIASGKKTVEVRKTRPKLETPFKVYIYCTQNTPYNPVIPMMYEKEGGNIYIGGKRYAEFLTGKVIGEFICDTVCEYEAYSWRQGGFDCLNYKYDSDLSRKSCVSQDELMKYGRRKTLFGWHISDLVIYDQPRGLTCFYHYCGDDPKCDGCELLYYSNTECGKEEFCCSNMYGCKHLERPPQSWCYVEQFMEENRT